MILWQNSYYTYCFPESRSGISGICIYWMQGQAT